MVKAKVDRLKIPVFDLDWLSNGDSSYVLLAGGGGSAKSGVKNQIMVAKAGDSSDFEFVPGFLTDDGSKCGLCSGVSSGSLQDGTVVAVAIVEKVCQVLEVAGGSLEFNRKCDFTADFSADEGAVNCCAVLPSGMLVTGGDDSVCRLWKLEIDNKSKSWKVVLNGELTGHTSPIMSIAIHPTKSWISTSSKDGSCMVWNTATAERVAYLPHLKEGIAAPPSGGKLPVSVESRGSCFSPCGTYLYSIQSPRRGQTCLVKWVLTASSEEGSADVVAYPLIVVAASKVPSTRLKINSSGSILALGSSDGSVNFFDSRSLSKIDSATQHDLPVTGLGFAPGRSDGLVVSCSADNKMASMKVAVSSGLFKFSTLQILGILISIVLFFLKLKQTVLEKSN